MSISIDKLTENLNIHQNLPDQPTLSSEELKKEWDRPANTIKEYINETLVGKIEESFNEESAKIKELSDKIEPLADELEEKFDEYKQEIDEKIEEFEENYDSKINNVVEKVTAYSDFIVTTSNFTASVHGGNLGSNAISVTKAGYFPLGIVSAYCSGMCSGVNYIGSFEGTSIDSRSSGKITYRVWVRGTSSEAAIFGIEGTVSILWVKIK